MAVNIKLHSRLRFGRFVEADGVAFWDTIDLPEIPVQEDDIQYTIQSTDRIDRLARRFYGDPVLWWVIALANGMEIVPTELLTSDTLRIPSPRWILQNLFTRPNKRRN